MAQVSMADLTLEQRNLQADTESISRRLAAFADREAARKITPPPLDEESCREDNIPSISSAELDGGVLRQALLDHGALIVRGLIPAEVAAVFQEAIDAVQAAGDPRDPQVDDWYSPPGILGDLMPAAELARNRHFHYQCGSVMCVEAPRVAEELLQLYERLGLRDLIRDYLGEEPCLSARKWVLRKSRLPISESGWHQDGAFMGTDISSLNMWIPLTRCGGDTGAPGMDVIPRRLNQIASAKGASFEWAVSPDTVNQGLLGAAPVSPEFEPGDAFFFDHFYLHRTQYGKPFDRLRYAIETWFFGSESFPKNQVPMAW